MNVEHIHRRSAILTPSDLPCLKNVCSVDISAGCAHECVYCYSRSYSQAPPEGTVRFYANTLEKMKDEWPRKRKKPERVYFCPSSDLFQPVQEILDAAHEMLAFILRQGARVAITTKGRIPEAHLALLCDHAERGRRSVFESVVRKALRRLGRRSGQRASGNRHRPLPYAVAEGRRHRAG